MRAPEVVVVGSINYDLFVFQDRLPAEGETLLAGDSHESFGGKGANQAVQAARLGAAVAMIGAVGDDDRGRASVANLRANGVETLVETVDAPTGLGLVNVLPGGRVHATVAPGANSRLGVGDLDAHAAALAGARVVVVQNEIAPDVTAAAMSAARRGGAFVVYNAAPAVPGSLELAGGADLLVVNEEEALACTAALGDARGAEETAEPVDWHDVAARLARTVPHVLVTLGERGAVGVLDGATVTVPAERVDAVDTTGAGDSFVGAVAAALADGIGLTPAARLASRVAARTTLGAGAQSSMPSTWEDSGDPLRTAQGDPGAPAVG